MASAVTAAALGDTVTVTGAAGSITVPLELADVIDDVVWLPMNSPGCHIYSDLGATPGASVRLTAGGAA
jgi:NADH-quinone oxidoreductase subunit G